MARSNFRVENCIFTLRSALPHRQEGVGGLGSSFHSSTALPLGQMEEIEGGLAGTREESQSKPQVTPNPCRTLKAGVAALCACSRKALPEAPGLGAQQRGCISHDCQQWAAGDSACPSGPQE
mmetsp:Transcript_43371/g.73166  ORF Transcript_43371/g.73166 Transcript_43371/m.73166 type:complete len:122 (+) Transcript_43371:334-699(+)